jgi:tetratricopeptide (TPR) repeat protein
MHLANDVLREARQRGFRDIEAEALSTLGTTCWRQGNAAAAITCLKQAVEMFTALKMHPEANYARGSLGVALVMAGQAEESAEVSKRALNYFRERGDLRSVAKILSNLGFTAYAQGEFETARSYLNRCTQLEAELKDRPLVMTTNYNLGLLELQEGHANAAKKPLTRAYHIAQETGDMTTEGAALMYLAVVALYEGLPDEATNYLALSQARYAGQPSDESQLVLHYLPVAVLAGGGVERALRLWSERPQLASYEACLDDLRNLSQLLTFLQTGGRSRGLALPAEALELAAQWKDEVEALLKQHTPAKAKSAER